MAEESHELKGRGWYQSSAGVHGAPAAERALMSPTRVSPRGAVTRLNGPPRGIFEGGFQRVLHLTADTREPVESINN